MLGDGPVRRSIAIWSEFRDDCETRRVAEYGVMGHQRNREMHRCRRDPEVSRMCRGRECVSALAARETQPRMGSDEIVVDGCDASEPYPALKLR